MSRLALALLLATAASAAAEPVAWQGVRGLGLDVADEATAESAIADGLARGGWFDEVDVDLAGAAACRNQVACHCAAARRRGVPFASFGTLGRLGGRWTLELSIVDAHACTLAAVVVDDFAGTPAQAFARFDRVAQDLATRPERTAASAGKRVRGIDDTPAMVTALPRELLRGWHVDTLEEALELIPGVEPLDANWGTTPLHRGLPDTLLVAIDGVPLINEMNNLRSLPRDFRASLRHIARIEVVRGPAAVLWGQNAFLGVIHLTTDEPTREEPVVDAGVQLTSADGQEAWASGAQRRGDHGVVVAVDVGRRRGLSTHVDDSPYAVFGVPAGELAPWGNGGTTEPGVDRWFDAFAKVRVGRWLSAFVHQYASTTAYEISPSGPLADPGRGGIWDKTQRLYGVNLRGSLGPWTPSLQLSRFEFTSWEEFFVQPAIPGVDASASEPYRRGLRALQGNRAPRTAHQLEARLDRVHALGAGENRIVGGVVLSHLTTPVSLSSLTPLDADPVEEEVSFGAKRFYTGSVFALDEWTPVPWLTASIGTRARGQRSHRGDGRWNFGADLHAGLVVNQDGLGAKLVYAEGYRSPNAVALFSTVGTMGNPDLAAERSRELATQANLRLTGPVELVLGGSLARLSGLLLRRNIVGDPTFIYRFENGGETDVAHAFAEARMVTTRVEGFARYGWTGLRETDPISEGIPVAPHGLSAGVRVRPRVDLSAMVRVHATSPRTVLALAPDVATLRRLPWAVRMSAGVTVANLLPGVDVSLEIDNPLGLSRQVPYRVDGAAGFVETRDGTELFATIAYRR